jgi:protocatechuate 3,4-dioxygenase beta subunit
MTKTASFRGLRLSLLVAFFSAPLATALADQSPLTVTVTELGTDKPIAGATVGVFSSPYNKEYADTGSDGVAHMVPKGTSQIVVQIKDYAPVRRNLSDDELKSSDHSLKFVMERGIRIGGSVVDQDGKGIAGATILWTARKTYPDGKEILDALQRTATTGADGRWSYDHMPEDATDVSIGAFHPAYLTSNPAVNLEPMPDLVPLRDGSHKFTLTRGIPVEITVRDAASGKPLPKARINYGPDLVPIAVRPIIETDAAGHVTLGVPAGTDLVVTVTAKGLAPELQRTTVGQDPKTLNFDLQPAATITGRVVDLNGNGIAGAFVTIDSWRDAHTLRVTNGIRTEDDGSFKWTAAPLDAVKLRAGAAAYDTSDPVSAKAGEPVEIVLHGKL